MLPEHAEQARWGSRIQFRSEEKAERTGSGKPIMLINGRRVVNQLMEHGIGVINPPPPSESASQTEATKPSGDDILAGNLQ